MDVQPQPLKHLRELFSPQKCWMIDDISRTMGYSVISIRRFLKQIGYFRSYNHNGKWYTLQNIPVFDTDGLWFYEDIGFSEQGNLTQAISYLINRAEHGCTARELIDKLHVPCHPLLSTMYKAGRIDRIKCTDEYSYLSVDKSVNKRQRESLDKAAQPLSTEAAVFVLVEFINNPQLSFKELAVNLKKKKNIIVAAESIDRFFQEHGVKKTPDSLNLLH